MYLLVKIIARLEPICMRQEKLTKYWKKTHIHITSREVSVFLFQFLSQRCVHNLHSDLAPVLSLLLGRPDKQIKSLINCKNSLDQGCNSFDGGEENCIALIWLLNLKQLSYYSKKKLCFCVTFRLLWALISWCQRSNTINDTRFVCTANININSIAGKIKAAFRHTVIHEIIHLLLQEDTSTSH